MIRKSVSIIALLTLISRILGLLRSTLQAHILGTTLMADAFTIAYKIPNLFRRLVGEGSLTAAFIPVFSDVKKSAGGDITKESVFLSKFFSVSILILTILCALGMIFTPLLVKILYAFGPQSPEAAIFLTRYMFPYLAFISLAAIAQSTLNANFKFAVPAMNPIILNLITIAAVFSFKDILPDEFIFRCFPKSQKLLSEDLVLMKTAKGAISFGIGVLLGGLMQFVSQMPSIFKLGYKIYLTADFKDKHIPEIGKLMLPGIFGLGIYQINVLIADPFTLAFLEEGCIAALNYSNRLMEFSLGIFVVSLSTVILPSLSKYVSEGNMNEYGIMFRKAINTVIIISLPASFGMILLRDEIVSIIFKYGLFSDNSAHLVSSALLYHSMGIVLVGIARIYTPAFYSLKDTKTPVIGAFISLITNIIFCFFLPRLMGIGGIALASTLAVLTNAGYLVYKLHKKIDCLNVYTYGKALFLSFGGCIIMSLGILLLKNYCLSDTSNKLLISINLILEITAGSALYFCTMFLFKVEELDFIKKKFGIGKK